MNLKETVAIAFAVTAAFASFGCGGSGKPSTSSQTQSVSTQPKKNIDETEIKNIMRKLESTDIAERKEACALEKLPGYSLHKTPLLDNQSAVQDAYFNRTLKFGNLTVSDLKQEGNIASARLSFTAADNKQYTMVEHFIRIDTKWVFDAMDCKASKALQVTPEDASHLEAAANIGYTYKDELFLVFDVRSKTATNYRIGWAQPATFLLITDAGEFLAQNIEGLTVPTERILVSSSGPIRFILPFKGATGKPKSLRITGFNELTREGGPLNNDVAQVVTFTLSE